MSNSCVYKRINNSPLIVYITLYIASMLAWQFSFPSKGKLYIGIGVWQYIVLFCVMASRSIFFFVLLVVLLYFKEGSAQLSSDFYNKSCSKALSTIRNAVAKAVVKEHRMGASLLRLHFHDCFVNVCSYSLLQWPKLNSKSCHICNLKAKSSNIFSTIRKISALLCLETFLHACMYICLYNLWFIRYWFSSFSCRDVMLLFY